MSKRNNTQQQQQPITLRRSPRFLHKQNSQEPQDPNTQKSKSSNKSNNGSRKSPRFNNNGVVVVDGLSNLRRSPRISNSNQGNDKEVGENFTEKKSWSERRIVVGLMSRCMCKERSCEGIEMVKVEECGVRSEEIGIMRKRRRGEDCNGSSVHGWTKEQEVALQNAYFVTKPTPHFWKKVSKLVPGKSAQECFDKVHIDHITPPQPQRRSRANRLNSSALEHFSLSASKLLQPTEPKIKKLSCNKQKSHLAQKTVRQLLQKHCHVDQDYEADLFSVLESNLNPSTQAYQSNGVLSTPKHEQEKQGFLQKCRERSSSGHKKPLSRFSGSCGIALVSPPVLKQVKNRALHEKYIDRLHCREAKRKAASARAEKCFAGKENRSDIHVQKINVVKAAKNALVSDARDAINQLQHLQNDTLSSSSDFNDDAVDSDDDEGDL